MTYTPEPWEHYDRGGMGWDIDGPPAGSARRIPRIEADARLAASAPNLLEVADSSSGNVCAALICWHSLGSETNGIQCI